MVQWVKNPPAMWETWVRSLGQEAPPEEGMATHSSISAWRVPWREEPNGGCKGSDITEATEGARTHTHTEKDYHVA